MLALTSKVINDLGQILNNSCRVPASMDALLVYPQNTRIELSANKGQQVIPRSIKAGQATLGFVFVM